MDHATRSEVNEDMQHSAPAMDARLMYNSRIAAMREYEYPMLKDAVYLDHSGTTLYSRTQIEAFSKDMLSNLYGNPHSGSASSQLAASRVDDVRHQVLRFFGAESAHFDIVFVANATAGAKLVMEAFRDHDDGFWYGYHKDSHTSLVGVREVAKFGHRCFASDAEVEDWIDGGSASRSDARLELFEYPAQSNMDGRRLPMGWAGRIRRADDGQARKRYTLLDAAAYASTAPLNLRNPEEAPDFTVVSFNKIFGFPDLGGLIIRNLSSHVLMQRRYFGGGTVNMVLCLGEQGHSKKSAVAHEALEDGTLPIHNIIALGAAMNAHAKLFGSLNEVSEHTRMLADQLSSRLSGLVHGNGVPVCELYRNPVAGPIVAFNIRNAFREWVSSAEIEKLALLHSFHVRSGSLCNPGGVASALGLQSRELKAKFAEGQRCGEGESILGGKPFGVMRISFGAMSTIADMEKFVLFLEDYFVDDKIAPQHWGEGSSYGLASAALFVESLTVYPLKSCGGWRVPTDVDWSVRPEGLALDREWCLVHRGTSAALNQKRYPKMALVRPEVDMQRNSLRISYHGPWSKPMHLPNEIEVPLSTDARLFQEEHADMRHSLICSDRVMVRRYRSAVISEYFSSALGVPCQLARFPPASAATSQRHIKDDIQLQQSGDTPSPLLCSNESPILTITRASLNQLNEEIKARGGKAARSESFRANIVIAQALNTAPGEEQAYAEDDWDMLRIGSQCYTMLGLCRRCQMVCIDQRTGERGKEPFATLAKTRRFQGKVWFGRHTCHMSHSGSEAGTRRPATIKVGQDVTVLRVLGKAGSLPVQLMHVSEPRRDIKHNET